MEISHVPLSAVLGHPVATAQALLEIAWRLPARVLRVARTTLVPYPNEPTTSLRVAIGTAVYAALVSHNWRILLGRPLWGVDRRVGLLYPDDPKCDDLSEKYGFHGYVYVGRHSPAIGSSSLKGADAVWIHAHGGGFLFGEARMYHHCFMRWIDRAYQELGMDLRVLSVEYPLSSVKPYPGCIDALFAAYEYVIGEIDPCKVVIAGDSAGGNIAISTCFRTAEQNPPVPPPAGVIMLSPWLDLTRASSGHHPNQPADWLTTADGDATRTEVIERYMGTEITSAADPRVSPLFRDLSSVNLPPQFLSVGKCEIYITEALAWARKVREDMGPDALQTYFAPGQVHIFAMGGWVADRAALEESDALLLDFVHRQTGQNRQCKTR